MGGNGGRGEKKELPITEILVNPPLSYVLEAETIEEMEGVEEVWYTPHGGARVVIDPLRLIEVISQIKKINENIEIKDNRSKKVLT